MGLLDSWTLNDSLTTLGTLGTIGLGVYAISEGGSKPPATVPYSAPAPVATVPATPAVPPPTTPAPAGTGAWSDTAKTAAVIGGGLILAIVLAKAL